MKSYSVKRKIISVLLAVFAFIMLIGSWGAASEVRSMTAYDSYYRWEITSASVQKQEDGRYLITAVIKNDSSYRAVIDVNDIAVKYGDEKRLENEIPEYPDGHFYDTLRKCAVPAGQTAEYELLITVPEGINAVRLSYHGMPYKLAEITGGENTEWEEKIYTVKI